MLAPADDAPLPVCGRTFEGGATHVSIWSTSVYSSPLVVHSAKADEVDLTNATFDQHTEHYRKRLRRQTEGVINPNGKFQRNWDLVIAFLLLLVATLTPYEVPPLCIFLRASKGCVHRVLHRAAGRAAGDEV